MKRLALCARRAIKSFDQTFSKVWLPAGPPVYGDLFLMDSRTFQVLARLTETGDCLQSAWAPHGDRIVFVSAGKK